MSRDGDETPSKPRVKKSETLEVRIPYETKQAFLSACREDGTTASEVVREQVQSYLDARERPPLQEEKRTLAVKLPPNVIHYAPRIAAGGALAIGLTALAVLPSAAAPDFKAQFSRLDANGDGVLSVEEFIGPKPADGETNNLIIETRTVTRSGDKPPAEIKIDPAATHKEAFAFYLPEELGGGAAAPSDQKHEFKIITHSQTRTASGDDGATVTVPHTVTFSMDDMRKQEFASIDANSDGKVSLDEYRARQTAMFTRGFEMLDTDADKSLSPDEYAKIVAPPMVHVPRAGGPDAPDLPKIEIPVTRSYSPEAVKAAFTRLDADKNGKLSLQEYLPKP